MGQQNSRFDSSGNHLNPADISSPGPDPFHHSPPVHRTAPVPHVSPAFYHAPHSAPVIPTSLKPKGLIRSLSAKRRSEKSLTRQQQLMEEPDLPPIGNLKALKTLGQVNIKKSMKEFETLVQRAEIEAGIEPPSINNDTSSTFPRHRIKRSSIGEEHFERDSPIPTLSATPAYLRPTPYRRSSASSIHSSRVSIKSARRAEREWRAKVAALSSGFSPVHQNDISPTKPRKSKGPVPPKRIPNSAFALSASQTSRSPSPPMTEEGTIVITPPHSAPTSFGTPLSNKSFETLGHYPNSSAIESPSPASNSESRERKPSVPYSVYSSVYSTVKDGYEGLARPISFASGQWLAPHTASPLKVDITSAEVDDDGGLFSPNSLDGNETATTPSCKPPHRESLPPFDSFKSSPRLIGDTALPQFDMPSSPSHIEHSWNKTEKKHQSLPSPPRPSPSQARRPSLHIPSLVIPNTPPTLPPFTFSAPSSPGPTTPIKQVPSTPTNTVTEEEPATPYSPTTAYILSAPSPTIDQLAFSDTYGTFATSPEKKQRNPHCKPVTPISKHPFTIGAKPSPEATAGIEREPSGEYPSVSSKVVLRHATTANNGRAFSPASGVGVIPRRSSIDPFIPRQLPSTMRPTHPNALMSRHVPNIPSMKAGIIGTSEEYVKEPGLKRLRGKVNLTPGMENGCRPPKSGLPMADLERWLRDASLSS
ncbi:uncharacterized protein IL334_005190 [Kwoniella shivajii]|uniref:Uncharacterized protein n=1 Tax=Kwoniella shivajii TaxID=564305 RepID=A0ABZ1D2F8_9TREE|nr:hypothetical protein IL334_005190 [Kwoniella shivajii]